MMRRILGLGALLSVALPSILSAGGIESANVPAAAFVRAEERVDDCTYDHEQSALVGQSGAEQCCVLAPVSLPDGAEVEALTLYFVKADSEDLSLALYRSAVTSVQIEQMAVVDSSTFPPSGQVRVGLDFSIDHEIVDNGTFAYYLGTVDCLDTENHSLYSAIVSYTPGGGR